MKDNSISFHNKLFDLEARLDNDFETGQMFWVIIEFGPFKEYFPKSDAPYGRRWIWQFYIHVPLWHFTNIGDRDKFR